MVCCRPKEAQSRANTVSETGRSGASGCVLLHLTRCARVRTVCSHFVWRGARPELPLQVQERILPAGTPYSCTYDRVRRHSSMLPAPGKSICRLSARWIGLSRYPKHSADMLCSTACSKLVHATAEMQLGSPDCPSPPRRAV